MASLVTTDVFPLLRPLRATKTDYRALGFFFFLSFFELPVVWIGRDAIGLYDVYIWLLVFYLIFRTRGLTMHMPWAWRSYFLVFFCYIVYLFFELLYFVDFRAAAILFKFAEAMIAMSILYTFFTQIDLDPKRVIRLVEINLVLLCLFQLYSFVDNLHRIGPIPPGFGIGLWYRLSLPFMAGVSSNPAGFVAGTYILFNIFVRNRRQIERRTFLFVTFLLMLCLLFTISRTNLFVTVLVLVIYLLRRSFERIRYLIAIGVVIAVILMLINFLVDTVPQDSSFWYLLNVVKNPSQILARIDADGSFRMRYLIAWPDQIHSWLTNAFTFFFGNGIAYYGIADGTYTGLLANQGVVGLSFFIYLWYIHFLSVWRSKLPFLWILFLYVLLNGTTADTLVTSYRSVQPYVVVVFVLLFAFGGLRPPATRSRE